jgi:hypothetical protein
MPNARWKCKDCVFFHDFDYCRINPPRLVESSDGPYTSWPTTDPDDWCGQFMTATEHERERLYFAKQKHNKPLKKPDYLTAKLAR